MGDAAGMGDGATAAPSYTYTWATGGGGAGAGGGAATPAPTSDVAILGDNGDNVGGCLASAGYSWCAPLNKCLRPWEEKCEAPISLDVVTAAPSYVPSPGPTYAPTASPSTYAPTPFPTAAPTYTYVLRARQCYDKVELDGVRAETPGAGSARTSADDCLRECAGAPLAFYETDGDGHLEACRCAAPRDDACLRVSGYTPGGDQTSRCLQGAVSLVRSVERACF